MNGILIVDKPENFTSHDVIAKLRGILKEKRIGHAGTLDPMATGVLPVFIGRATRAVEFCESADKEYIADIKLGITTDTQDTTGTILETRDHKVTREDLEKAVLNFLGEQEQIPPMYSAIKVNGQKLYSLARKGIEVHREPRKINIISLDIMSESSDGYRLNISCSKGTYIRTLINDMGHYLGCGGTMSYLRRVRAGRFTIDNAVTLEQIAQAAHADTVGSLLLPVDLLFSEYPSVIIDDKQVQKCRNGNGFMISGLNDSEYRVYDKNGNFLMLGIAQNGLMKTRKSFFEVNA